MARLVIYVGLCVTAALLAGCGSAQSEGLGRFELSGVAVEVSYTPEGPSGQAITVRFDPGDGFHLYAASMPAGGIDGIGRPTAVDITGGDLIAAGPMAVDLPVELLDVEGVGQPLPVYPDGVVPVSLPVTSADGREPLVVQLAVTYMACSSDGGCRPPVEDHPLTLELT
jgi:hypothetical protein